MKTTLKSFILILFLILGSVSLYGQFTTMWQDIPESQIPKARGDNGRKISPSSYRTLELNITRIQNQLRQAPNENSTAQVRSESIVAFPLPNGKTESFRLVEYELLHPDLAARYPEIKTYRGVSITNPSNHIRVSWTAFGLEAFMIREQGIVAISPLYRVNQRYYQSYYKKELPGDPDWVCHFVGSEGAMKKEGGIVTAEANLGPCGNLRTFRTAMAATGEYSALVSPNTTKAEVLAEITNLMNAMNAVYEKDLAVRLQLIANNDDIIYLNSGTDPFTSTDLGVLIDQNQVNTDNVIGENFYDIGHLLYDTGGGLAGPTPCVSGQKAGGVSGTGNPVGPAFYIDLVAHEIGHQFGANHTQNNNCNRNNATAMEPGSASTIMGYAGICNPNVQNNSDPYFHNVSLAEMQSLIANFATCAGLTANGNTSPTVSAGGDFTIPISTPFMLTATGTGVNTYCWEQFDNEVSTQPPVSTAMGGPNFRSLNPVASPSRNFPSLANLLAGTTTWEVLPSVSRTMEFKVTARDNVMTGGCTADDMMTVTFDANFGPFTVTSPNTAVTWTPAATETVTWNVANTNNAPVSCANVDIMLSTDGGLTFPITLATNVTNDGSHDIVVPNNPTATARVRVKCSTSIFFDISDVNFTIGNGGGNTCDQTAIAITCGQAYNGNTATGANNFASYPACQPWDESGNEVIHKITTGATGDITATLTNLVGGDLDVFILTACDNAASCIAAGTNDNNGDIATATNQAAGTYYVVVDGYEGASSTYTLTVTCEVGGGNTCDQTAVVLTCGQAYNGNTTTGANNISAYPACVDWDETGNEIVHKITTTSTGDITATLSNLGANDLDVFILTACDNAGSCIANGDETATAMAQAAGTYYIIVDGFEGASGTYTLTVTANCGGGGCDGPAPPANGVIASGTYHGPGSVTTSGQVLTPSDVTIKAGTDINLTNGFEVQGGAIFHALIDACNAALRTSGEEQLAASTMRINKSKALPYAQMELLSNPLNQKAIISYALSKTAKISIEVYDVNGDKVARPLGSIFQKPGKYKLTLQGDKYPPGIYIVVMRTPDGLITKRLNWID